MLGTIAELKGGVTKGQRRRPEVKVRGVPYLRVANVQRGFLDLREVKLIDATEDEIEQTRLRPGDVLFTEGGDRDKLGRGWVWNGEMPECIHQNHVFRARLYTASLEPKFVSWYGNSVGREYFEKAGKQTTNLASINLTMLRAFPVAVPPAAEQRRVVADVDRRLSVIDELEAVVEHSLRRTDSLRQAILKRAFEGKLVPQDPNDEPASVLLERIRAHRLTESQPRVKRRRRAAARPLRRRQRKTITDVLGSSPQGLTTEDLIGRCGYTHETVEEFYKELTKALHDGRVEEVRSAGPSVVVKLKSK